MSQEMAEIADNNVVSTEKYNGKLYLRLMGVIVGVALLGWIALRIDFYYSYWIPELKHIILGDILWVLCFATLIASCFQRREKFYIIPLGLWLAYYIWVWWIVAKMRNADLLVGDIENLVLYKTLAIALQLSFYSIVFGVLQIVFRIKKSYLLRLFCIVLSGIYGIAAVIMAMVCRDIDGVYFPICAGVLVLIVFIAITLKKQRISIPIVVLAITGGISLAIWLGRPIRALHMDKVNPNVLDPALVAVFVMAFCLLDIVGEYAQAEKQPRVKKVNDHVKEKTQPISGNINAVASARVDKLFCPACGTRFPEGKKFCDQCGSALSELAQPESTPATTTTNVQDVPSKGIAVLSFFVPAAGFIMWVAWNTTMPRKAKSAGKWALIGLIVFTVLLIADYIFAYAWTRAWVASLLGN